MKDPLVSIISPTYNHEAYIAECIESVLAQSYQNWEMLIVDDGSTDATWEIVQRYAAKDRRVRAFTQPNMGIWRLEETYNFALERSRGELIAILEGDDYWPIHKLAVQVRAHRQVPDLILSHGTTKVVQDGGAMIDYCSPPVAGVQSASTYLKYALLCESCLMPVSVMMNRRPLIDIGGFWQAAGFPAVDYPTFVQLMQAPGQVAYLPDTLGYWRQSQSQVTQTMSADLANAALRIALETHSQLPIDLSARVALTPDRIERAYYAKLIMPSCLANMRKCLREREPKEARNFARQLMKRGSPKRRAQGIVGYVASYLGLDIDPVFSTYEKVFMRQQDS